MKKFFKILVLVIICSLVVATFYWLWSKSRPEPIVYEIINVDNGTIENTSVVTGSVSPRDEVLIKPQISGIIAEIRKEAGDFVTTGEVIAVLKVIPEMAQLNSAESRLRIAKLSLEQVESEYKRQKALYEKGVISKEEMENSETSHKKSMEEVDNAQDNLDIVRDGISKSTAQMSTTQVRSTINGMILDVPVKIGNSVIQTNNFNEGTTIAAIADMNDMIFIGKIDETEVGRVHVGMPMKLSIGALGSQSFDAELEYISPKGVEESGAILFEIKAAAAIPDSVDIRAGYSANGEIVLERAADVILVPESVLSFESDSTFVYNLQDTVAMPQIFDRVLVETGISDGINVEITKGLNVGQKLRGTLISGNPTMK